MKKKIHVLIFPSYFPSSLAPINGDFFVTQINALATTCEDTLQIGVIAIIKRGLKDLYKKLFSQHFFATEVKIQNSIPYFFWYGCRIPFFHNLDLFLMRQGIFSLFRKYINEYGKPDIIHAHNILFGGYIAALLAKEFSIPLVVTEHSSYIHRNLIKKWELPLILYTISHCAKLIAVGNSLAQQLTDLASTTKISTNKISVIPNLIETNFFAITPKEINQPNSSDNKFHFIAIGNLIKLKGYELLLQAFAKAFANNDNIQLDIGGTGPEMENLIQLTKELKIERKIRFLGLLSKEQVKQTLQNANCLVHASLSETFGVVIIEAMSVGLPVIATRCGGPEDIVTESTGILVEKNNIDALAIALKKMLANIQQNKYNKNSIRNYVLENFSAQSVCKQISSVYYNVIKTCKDHV